MPAIHRHRRLCRFLVVQILIVVSALATNGFFVPAATLAADALAPSSGASTNAFVQQSLSWTDLLAKALKPNAEPTVFPPPTSQESEHWDERIERIFFCLLLSSKHLNLHQAVYRQVVDVKSPKLGMRQDDLYGLLLHSIWSSCYYKSLSHSVASLYHLSSARAATLTSPAEIPAKFSYQLLQDIDLTIKYFAETQFSAGQEDLVSPSWPTTSWRDSWCFAGLWILLLFCLLSVSIKKIARACKKKLKGTRQTLGETPLNSSKRL